MCKEDSLVSQEGVTILFDVTCGHVCTSYFALTSYVAACC